MWIVASRSNENMFWWPAGMFRIFIQANRHIKWLRKDTPPRTEIIMFWWEFDV